MSTCAACKRRTYTTVVHMDEDGETQRYCSPGCKRRVLTLRLVT